MTEQLLRSGVYFFSTRGPQVLFRKAPTQHSDHPYSCPFRRLPIVRAITHHDHTRPIYLVSQLRQRRFEDIGMRL